MHVNFRRFFAFFVLAGWIALTPVTVRSGMDWAAQETLRKVTLQEQHDLGQAVANTYGTAPSEHQMIVVEDPRAQRSPEESVLKAFSDLGDKALSASRTAALRRTQFWWEFGAWVLLTALGSALFAEGKEKHAPRE